MGDGSGADLDRYFCCISKNYLNNQSLFCMKKFLYLIVLCTTLASCSQTEEIRMQEFASAQSPQKKTASHHNNLNVYEYISANQDLFGNPLVFNSMDEADYVLDSLQSMNSQQLEEWIKSNDFHNPIIESHYRYLSIYEKKQAEFASVSCFASETDRLNSLIAAVTEEMETNYPSLCAVSEQMTTDNHLVKSVKPLGDFDIYALCNEQGIVVIDKVVFWLVEDDLISCPIDQFVSIANQVNVCGMDDSSNLQENADYVIARNVFSNSSSAQNARIVDDHIRYYEASNGDYKLTIYMTAYPYWGWGTTNYRSKVTITNLYKGSEYEASISGYFHYYANGQYGDLITYLHFNDYLAPGIEDKFKSKTYRENILMDRYTKTKNTYVDITSVYVNIIQDTGMWEGLRKKVVTININEK